MESTTVHHGKVHVKLAMDKPNIDVLEGKKGLNSKSMLEYIFRLKDGTK